MRWVIFCKPPLSFSANHKKTYFRENQKRQKCDFGHFLTSDVIHIFLLCRILKSTYGTNETFFSRTHRFGCELQTSDRRLRIEKWQRDNYSAAHVCNGMVPGRPPETVVSRTASRVATRHTRCRVVVVDLIYIYICIYIYIDIYIYLYTMKDWLVEQIASKITEIHTHSINLMIFLLKVYKLRSVQIACESTAYIRHVIVR